MNMKKLKKLLFLCLMVPAFASVAQVSFGDPVLINNNWRFTLSDPEGAEKPEFNDRRWQRVTVPHDWSVKGYLSPSLASATGYLPGGIGWYRKSLDVPASEVGRKVYLYFEGIYNRSEVYINGHLLGKRPNGYISFMYDATPFIEYGKSNTIAVRVDHSKYADSRWYTGSGIYRDVYAVYASPLHIAQWGVFAVPELDRRGNGIMKVNVELTNALNADATVQIINELKDPSGKSVGKSTQRLKVGKGGMASTDVSIRVRNPILWDLENPALYTLHTSVLHQGKVIDATTTRTGFREFTFDPNKGFALNGTWMKMKGVCLHHDSGVLGAEVYEEVWRRRLETLKSLGVNAIRTSHNPQAPNMYALCDELGLLVMNEAFDEWEFPKRKWLEGWNVGTPGFEGTYDFFEEWGEKDLEDMVKRDRNHISIFSWSIGNEVDYPNDPYSHPVLGGENVQGFTQAFYGGYQPDAPDAMRLGAIAKRLAAVVRKFDPSRPVTAGLAGVAMSNETEYPDALDIAGYNYTESMYDSDHEKYPERVIYGSENRHDMQAWKDVRDREFVFGQFLWTGIDYLGESGPWPSRGFYSGLIDFAGFVKPRGEFRRALWVDEPVAYIGTYPSNNRVSIDAWPNWNYEDGQMIRVVVYTNAASARLNLNGKQVGEQKPYDDNTGVIYWDIPYKAGKLEVVGLDKDGKQVVTHAIQTSGRPHAITLCDESLVVNSGDNIAQVIIEIKDENGILVFLADNELHCHIDGPAELLGLESGNNTDMSIYTDAVHRVHHGKMVAFVRVLDRTKPVTVRFTSPFLKTAEATLQVK
jgi:beta-galactosidase